MSHADGHPADTGGASAFPPFQGIEIVAPVADALGVLADLLQRTREGLAGASIAKSDRGTLLLNAHAWSLFGEALKSELAGLIVMQPARDSSKPIRFVLVTTEIPRVE
jgi:hypothetical protein